MKVLKKVFWAIVALYLAAAALVVVPPADAAPATDSLRVTFHDGYANWQTLGPASGGNVVIAPSSASAPFFTVSGTLNRPGQSGGTASVTFDVHAFFGLSFGKVVVSDPSVALYVIVPVLFRPVTRSGVQASGTASWFNPGFKGFYQFEWVVNDEA